jgi:hypothetical protein
MSLQTVVNSPDLDGEQEGDVRFDVFMIYSRDQTQHAEILCTALKSVGIRAFLPCSDTTMASSAEGQHVADMAKVSSRGLLLLSREFLNRIEEQQVGDSCCNMFNLSKRLRGVSVAAMEPSLHCGLDWGWNAVFARFSGVKIWNLSHMIHSKEWYDAVHGLVAELKAGVVFSEETMRAHSAASLGCGQLSHTQIKQPAQHGHELSCKSTDRVQGQRVHMNTAFDRCRGLTKRQYDCFLTHNWGPDEEGRDNHDRVHGIAKYLRRGGLEVFLDVWEMGRYNSIDKAMVEGMKSSSLSVIFITQKYIDKIAQGGHWDNCVAEFNLSRKCPNVLPVVMEPKLQSPNAWGWNTISAQLSNTLFLNLSWDHPSWASILLTLGWSPKFQRWTAALCALYERIRQDVGKTGAPIGVANEPPPIVPHRDHILIVAYCLLTASLLESFRLLGRLIGLNFSHALAMEIVAQLKLAMSFHFLMQWFFLMARVPPDFEFKLMKLPFLQTIAAFLRCIAAILVAVAEIERWRGSEQWVVDTEDRWAWVTNLAASNVAAIDCFVLSRHAPWGFDAKRPCAFSNLPSWSALCLAIASYVYSAPEVLVISNLDAVHFVGTLITLVAAGMLLIWALLGPSMVVRYYAALRASCGEDRDENGKLPTLLGSLSPGVPVRRIDANVKEDASDIESAI